MGKINSLNLLFISIFFIFFKITFSQETNDFSLDSYIKSNNYLHLKEQEKFFLHVNKNIFFPGEKIWFKAYVVSDLFNNPYLKTTNLYVNFYDPTLKLLSSDLLYVTEGKAHGNISLPDDVSPGTYYIQLETEYSKNFKSQYINTVEVVNSNLPKNNHESEKPNNQKQDLEISFYPESGVLLERADNKVGIKATYKGRPININGKLLDNKTGRILKEVSTDSLGLGFFDLLHYPDRTYTLQVKIPGKTENYILPQVNKMGFAIEKKGKKDNHISFKIKTNKATLKQNAGKFFYGVLHRRGAVQQVIPFKLDPDYAYYGIDLNIANTLNGINAFTLFNDHNEPISERLFFVDKGDIIDLKIQNVTTRRDTLRIDFKPNKINSPLNLSISVLPAKTKVYRNIHNITSSFLAEPYLPESGSNLISFLKGTISEKQFDNYLLTLTDKNSFPDKDFPKNEKHAFEQGLKIKGRVFSKDKFLENGRVMLSSEENNILLLRDLQNRNEFVFDSLYLAHSSEFKLALIDKRGKIVPATFKIEENYSEYNPEQKLDISGMNSFWFDYEKKEPSSFFISSANQLDEVLLEGKSRKFDYSDLIPDPTILGGSWNKKSEIDENLYSGDNTMLDVIKDLPGIQSSLVGGKLKIRNNRGFKSIIERQDVGEGSSSFDMLVVLNGITVSEIELLREFRADDIKSIKVNSMGAGYGLQGMNGVILIETKTALSVRKKEKPKTDKNAYISTADFGFTEATTTYEDPFIIFPNELSREYFSSIDWIPNFDLLPGKINYIELPLKYSNDLLLVINGLSKEGHLIYEKITIPVNSNNKENTY